MVTFQTSLWLIYIRQPYFHCWPTRFFWPALTPHHKHHQNHRRFRPIRHARLKRHPISHSKINKPAELESQSRTHTRQQTTLRLRRLIDTIPYIPSIEEDEQLHGRLLDF